MVSGKKSKAKTSTPGTNVTPNEDPAERNPSYHGRTFTNSRIAPTQPPNQRTAKRYAKALQAQEARRSIEISSAETVPPEVPEIIISASTTGNTSPYRPRTQSSPSDLTSLQQALSRITQRSDQDLLVSRETIDSLAAVLNEEQREVLLRQLIYNHSRGYCKCTSCMRKISTTCLLNAPQNQEKPSRPNDRHREQ